MADGMSNEKDPLFAATVAKFRSASPPPPPKEPEGPSALLQLAWRLHAAGIPCAPFQGDPS